MYYKKHCHCTGADPFAMAVLSPCILQVIKFGKNNVV